MGLGIGMGMGIGLGGGAQVLPFPTISSFAFRHNFREMQGTSSGGALALALDPNMQTIAGTNYLPDSVGGNDKWYVSNNRGWLAGPGTYRGYTNRGWTGVSPYPGGANSTYFSLSSTYKTAGTSLNAQDFSAGFIIQNSVRSNDANEADMGGAAVLLDMSPRAAIFIDLDNRIGISKTHTITAISQASPTQITSAGHGLITGDRVGIWGSNSNPVVNGWYTVTVLDGDNFTIPVDVATAAGTTGKFFSDQGLSNIYLHAGVNAIFVRATSTTVKFETYHGGTETVSYATGSGSSATMNFLASNSGHLQYFGSISEDAYFTSGSVSDADVAAFMNYARVNYGLVPHQNFLAFMGDSFQENFWGLPGSSIPNIIARANPTLFVYNAAKAGATLSTGVNSIQTIQVPRVRTAITTCKPSGGTAVVFLMGGANDVTSRDETQMSDDIDTIYTDLKVAASGSETPPDYYSIASPISRPQVGVSDANLETYESRMSALAPLIMDKETFEVRIDFKTTLSTPASNTAANLEAMVLANSRWTLLSDTTTLIAADSATSADGIHLGVYGQIEMADEINSEVLTLIP